MRLETPLSFSLSDRSAAPGLDRADRWTEEPFGLVRLVIGTIALVWTLIAVLLAVTGADPRALQLVVALWAIYGLIVGFLSGILEPVIDGFFRLVSNFGIVRVGGGYSPSRPWRRGAISRLRLMPTPSGRETSLSG